ncbi:MAG: hypothetical protein R6W82_00250 [bacterium]
MYVRRIRTPLLVLLLLVLAAPRSLAQEQEGPRPLEVEDYYRVRRVGDTALSPDGRHLLYTVQTVRRRQNDRLTEIWWADLRTGRNMRLSTAGVDSDNPAWTPDGSRIYFTTTRGEETGVHFLEFLEPGGEAYKLPGLAGYPAGFSPDGQWILITRSVEVGSGGEEEGERERARSERPSWPDGPPALTRRLGSAWTGSTEEERNKDVFVITHSTYKRDGRIEFIPPPSRRGEEGEEGAERYTQFFRIPAAGLEEGTEAEQLTSDEVNKRFEGYSPDGRHIIYTVDLTPEAEQEREEE